MRWELMIDTPGDDFAKLNNNYVSFAVRKFIEAHPGYGKIFVTRKSAADEAVPSIFPSKGGQDYMF